MTTFQQMRECGLTLAGFMSPRELDLCHAAGLRAIVSDPRASSYDWRNLAAPVTPPTSRTSSRRSSRRN